MGANGEAWAAAVEIKVLAWWQAKESKWPALAKMVKQYFAAPASSKGVERVFLAAGNKPTCAWRPPEVGQGLNAGSLEHSLFAAFNTD